MVASRKYFEICIATIKQRCSLESSKELKPNNTMNTIDLTSAESALNYLRSLPADQAISLPGHYTDAVRTITEESALNYRAFGVVTWETDGLSTTECDAVRAITEESAHTWAGNRRQWEWTAAALVATLEAEIADREAAANE